jgi:hypothetical protein
MVTLHFNTSTHHLHDNQGCFIPLARLDLEQLPWPEDAIETFELFDLPCRLPKTQLTALLQRLCFMAKANAQISFHLPHPRHDRFLMDADYVTPLLPETLQDVASKLGLPLEIEDVIMELDADWREAVEKKELTYEEVAGQSRHAANVIEWIQVKIKVDKNAFRVATTPALTPAMRKQLMDQLQMQMDRGNTQAVATIQKFLNGIPLDGP